jgi:hypothetical protein
LEILNKNAAMFISINVNMGDFTNDIPITMKIHYRASATTIPSTHLSVEETRDRLSRLFGMTAFVKILLSHLLVY